MDPHTIQRNWEAYTSAWADISSTERKQLVESSTSEDIEYSNPLVKGQGQAGILEIMREFQLQYPGARFELNSTTIHHDQLLSGWTLYAKDGSALMAGHNYARANQTGKLNYMAGFFKT